MDITGITEEYVQRSAVNASALANARKITAKNEFSGRTITADKTLIYGDCQGSGKEPYHTSVDVSGETVICRCSCPSRQIPCKHALALMLDYAAGKAFAEGEVPEDVARKREKLEKRAEKAAEQALSGSVGSGAEYAADDPEAAAKAAEAAQKAAARKKASADSAAKKKIKRQLDGLTLVSDFVRETMNAGVGTINSSTITRYKDLVKQLGDYYLSGPQRLMQSFVLAAEADHRKTQNGANSAGGVRSAGAVGSVSETNDNDVTIEQELVQRLVRLDQAAKKGKAWLEKQLESGEFGPQDDILYEKMGGIWRLDQLDALGLYRENAELVQLSFNVLWDETIQAEIDTGYWIDLESGEISKTENIRPVKAKKYIHADDSAFEVYTVKKLYRYPGGMNKRVRWDDATSVSCGAEVPARVLELARRDVSAAVKEVKNELKNTLSDNAAAMLIGFDRIAFVGQAAHGQVAGQDARAAQNAPAAQGGQAVLQLGSERLALRENANYIGAMAVLRLLPKRCLAGGALLGEFWYAPKNRALYLAPIAVVTENEILRLV